MDLMMQLAVTWGYRWESIGLLAGVLLLVGVVGYALLRVVGKGSVRRKVQGTYVFGWMLVGWIVGGAVGEAILDGRAYLIVEADVGCAGLGMLVGWVVGMIHGGVVVWRARRKGAGGF
jgi:hypothetical protein